MIERSIVNKVTRCVTAVGLVLTMSGCINKKAEAKLVPHAATQTQSTRTGPFQDAINYIEDLYPVLAARQIRPTGLYKIQTKSDISTIVINYTDHLLNVSWIKDANQTMEDIARSSIADSFQPYQLKGQDRYLGISPYPTSVRIMGFVQGDLPRLPDHNTNGITFPTNVGNISLVWITGDRKYDKLTAYIELCNETIKGDAYIKSWDGESYEPITDLTETHEGKLLDIPQELACNSLGDALDEKELGKTYPEYIERVSKETAFKEFISKWTVIPENIYASLPVTNGDLINSVH